MNYDWDFVEPGEELADLPEKLYLVTEDKKYRFDYAASFNGHIISARFKGIFEGLKKTTWEVAELEIVSPSGTKVDTQDSYFYIRQKLPNRTRDVIDLDKSVIEYRKDGHIKHITSLVIAPAIDLDFFEPHEMALSRWVIVSDHAAIQFRAANLAGVTLVPTIQLASVDRG